MIRAYHLVFEHPAHFGLEGIGQENVEQIVRSDTLWGAIIQKWLLLFQDDPDELCRNSPFNISSGFPLINGKRFYPLPIGTLDNLINSAAMGELENTKLDVKKIKKIAWCAEELLLKILNGRGVDVSDVTPDNVMPLPLDEKEKSNDRSSLIEQRPRVRTDQLRGGVEGDGFFYCSDQFFNDESGLFFLADFQDKTSRKKFEAALNLLGDSGLGADRSIGRGYFRFEHKEINIQPVDKPDKYLLLSLYHPKKEEVEKGVMKKGRSAYSLIRRYGQAGSHLVNRFRRADCWMLAEGSVLPFTPSGNIVCVLKAGENIPHNVYRNGRAFCLPMAERGV